MLSQSTLGEFFHGRGRVLLDPTRLPSVQDSLPLPIYAFGRLGVVNERRENLSRIRAVSSAFANRNITDLRPCIKSIDRPSETTATARVRFHHFAGARPDGEFSDLVYYLHTCCGGIRIAMIEILHCPAYAMAEQRQFRRVV